VGIFSPADGSRVSGWVAVDVDAADNVGVTEVSLYAGSVWVGTDSVAPYQFSWDSTGVPDGNEMLTAYAYDSAGNEGVSEAVILTVDNQPEVADTSPPSVAITSPGDGSLVDGRVAVRVVAEDDSSVAGIWLYIDGALEATTASSSLEYNWNARKAVDGNYGIEALAVDGAGNRASTAISVIVGSQPDGTDADGGGTTKPGKGNGRPK
jgi:hypothetical protein